MRIQDVFTPEETRELVRPSDLRGLAALAADWAVIGGAFALVAAYPSVWTALAALVILGTRQLGLSVLMHECAHKSLFRTKWMNEVFGQWLCAYPIRFDMLRYRAEHMVHHKYAQTDRDPDLWLTKPFPTTPRGLRRKLTRDLLGQTGLRRVVGLFLLDIGYLEGSAPKVTKNANWTPREGLRRGFERLWRPVLFHAAFLAILTAFGHPELFLLWWAAYMTTYSVVLRIRAIAEHSVVPDVTDPWRHTRTTLASPLERAFLAPNWVNYHLEHHLIPNVPCYNLPAMHRVLRDRGALAETDAAVAKGYGEVLRLAASAQAVQPTPA